MRGRGTRDGRRWKHGASRRSQAIGLRYKRRDCRAGGFNMDSRNFTFMFYGFLAAWLILVAYAVLLVSREREIRDAIKNLKSMLEERGGK